MTATLIVLLAVVVLFAALERRFGHRPGPDAAHVRADAWFLVCDFLGNLVASAARLAIPAGLAFLARGRWEGPLAQAPLWGQVLAGSLLLEWGIWFTHWCWHRFDLLYRFHATHHAIEHVYFLSGLRQHPVQFLGDQLFFAALLTAVGLSAEAVLACSLVQLVAACYTHSNLNIRIPGPLKYLLASPRFHVLHHDRSGAHARKNLGGALSLFDYLFGTASDPDREPEPRALGEGVRDPRRVGDALLAPFRREPAEVRA
ncbi:MAG: sterol desaturase family protein [Planctomycetota bacterium]